MVHYSIVYYITLHRPQHGMAKMTWQCNGNGNNAVALQCQQKRNDKRLATVPAFQRPGTANDETRCGSYSRRISGQHIRHGNANKTAKAAAITRHVNATATDRQQCGMAETERK